MSEWVSASLLRLFLLELCSTFGMYGYVGSGVNVVCSIFGSYGVLYSRNGIFRKQGSILGVMWSLKWDVMMSGRHLCS